MRDKSASIQNCILISLAFLAISAWLELGSVSMYAQSALDIQIDDSNLPESITWIFRYSGESDIDFEQLMIEGSKFSEPRITEQGGLQIALYIDLWRTIDADDKRHPHNNEHLAAAIQPLSSSILEELDPYWNTENDSIAIFTTQMDRTGLPQDSVESGVPSLFNLYTTWQGDLADITRKLNELTLNDMRSEYNHAHLSDLLSKKFLSDEIGLVNSNATQRLVILISNGHDFKLHNKRIGNNIFEKDYAYEQEAKDEESEAIQNLVNDYQESNITIQPIYFSPIKNKNYHGKRYLNKLADAFKNELIYIFQDLDTDTRYKSELSKILRQTVTTVPRTAAVTFQAEQFSSLNPTIRLFDQERTFLNETRFELEQFIPTNRITWTRIPTDIITSTVLFRSNQIDWVSPPLPTLAEQNIQYQLLSKTVTGEIISLDVFNEGNVIINDNQIEVQLSSLPAGNYELQLTSKSEAAQQLLPNTAKFEVVPPRQWPLPLILVLAGLGLLLLLWALQQLVQWMQRPRYELIDEDTTGYIPVSTVGEGAFLGASAEDHGKPMIGRLLLVYGMNAAPIVQLSNEVMNFGANPKVRHLRSGNGSATAGRDICLSQYGSMHDMQFYIRPIPDNRLEIRDLGTSGSEVSLTMPDQENRATENNSNINFDTYLNDQKVANHNKVVDFPIHLSSGDIIRVGDHIKYRVVLNERYAGGRRMAYHQDKRERRTNGNPLSRLLQQRAFENEAATEDSALPASHNDLYERSSDAQPKTSYEMQQTEPLGDVAASQTPLGNQRTVNPEPYIYDWRLRNRQMKSRQSSQGKKQTGFWARLWGDPAQATREQQTLSRVADAIQEQTQSNGSFDSTIQQTDHFVADQDASHIEEDNAQHHSQAVAQIGKSERSNLKSGVPPSPYEPAADRGQPQAFQAGIGSDDSTQQSVPSGYPNRPTKTSSTSHQSAAVQPPDLSKEEPLKSTLGDQESVQQPIEDATQESKVDDKKKDDVDRKTNLEATRPRQATSLANPPDRNSERTKRDGLAKQIASERLPPSSTDRTESGDTAQFKSTTQSSKQSAIRSDEEQSESAIPNGLREEDDMTTQIRMVAFLPDENEDEGAVNDQPNDEDDKYRGRPKRTKT